MELYPGDYMSWKISRNRKENCVGTSWNMLNYDQNARLWWNMFMMIVWWCNTRKKSS